VAAPTLVFEPRLVPENTPMAPLDGLQTAMREGEARLAEALGDEAEMVVLDGPLTCSRWRYEAMSRSAAWSRLT
jgi:hypothetical protein